MVAEMNLDYEAIEHLKLALSRLSKAKRLLQNELMKVESCNNNRLSRSVIEESYVATIDTLLGYFLLRFHFDIRPFCT